MLLVSAAALLGVVGGLGAKPTGVQEEVGMTGRREGSAAVSAAEVE